MRTRRTALTAAALTVFATLALTACGGDGGNASDKIEGAEDAKKSSSPSAAVPTGAVDGVNLKLPKDVKLVFDFEAPSDPKAAAAQRDAANFVRSIYRGITAQSSDAAAARVYSRDSALDYAQRQIKLRVDAGVTVSGERRHYRSGAKASGNDVEVSFCMDQSKFFSKNVESGKVDRSGGSSDGSFSFYRILMAPNPTLDGVWQATGVDVKGDATECRA